MDKVIRDGKVAVLYSPGYGGGWYTWNQGMDCVFNPQLVELVEKEDFEQVRVLAKQLYGENFYVGGAGQLAIKWLPLGTMFTIEEYDGFESVITQKNFELEA